MEYWMPQCLLMLLLGRLKNHLITKIITIGILCPYVMFMRWLIGNRKTLSVNDSTCRNFSKWLYFIFAYAQRCFSFKIQWIRMWDFTFTCRSNISLDMLLNNLFERQLALKLTAGRNTRFTWLIIFPRNFPCSVWMFLVTTHLRPSKGTWFSPIVGCVVSSLLATYF